MSLAPDAIVIELDGAALTLRPTLRAAYRLDQREGSFSALVDQIFDGDMSAMAAVIAEAADHPTAIVDLIRDVALNGVERLVKLRDPLVEYLTQLLGTKLKGEVKPANPNVPTISRTEYLEKLFKIGCGNLGWTPADTWAASPAEIEAAFEGRLDLLQSIFGGGESQKQETRQKIPLSQRASATIAALGGKVVKRPRKDA